MESQHFSVNLFFSTSMVTIPRILSARSSRPHLTISAVHRQQPEAQLHSKPTTVATTDLKKSNSPKSISSSPARPSLAATICNALEEFINDHIDPPHLRPSVNPVNVLSGNFAPVAELPPTQCPTIIGTIPDCLAGGAYIRNGPNPHHLPRGTYHFFDGDGMLHTILLQTTCSAIFSSHYVRTSKFRLECTAGKAVVPNVISGLHGFAGVARTALTALRIFTGQIEPHKGVGLANINLAIIGNTLYAVGEADLPYAVHVSPISGVVTTFGRTNFDGKLKLGMSAHTKRDPRTGECFAFRWFWLPPFLTYFRFDKSGRKTGPDVPIHSIRSPTLIHDFALTDRYVIFPDIQFVMKPLDMLMGRGGLVCADPKKLTRLGVLPRYAETEGEAVRWFNVPGFNIFHVINSWEEGDTIVIIGPNVKLIEYFLERLDLLTTSIEMVRIDLKSDLVTRTVLTEGKLDFGVINPSYVGQRNRYAYMAVGCPFPKFGGLVKLDFEQVGNGYDCVVARRDFGPDRFVGEPFFVGDGGEGEDDGYLVTYLYDEGVDQSSFVVMDARSSELEVVAEVKLPQRVPYGFHGMFVTSAELQSQ